MSVNKLNVPTDFSEDSDISGKPTLSEADKPGNNVRAQTHRKGNGPDPVSKEFSDHSSANAESNRLRNNANDPTDRDSTRSTTKPLSGKIQK